MTPAILNLINDTVRATNEMMEASGNHTVEVERGGVKCEIRHYPELHNYTVWIDIQDTPEVENNG